jgi:hypothetical protein
VVRSGMTSRDEATKARDIFDQDRVRLVGTILNDFDPNKSGLNDYYKSYQRYMYGPQVDANGPVSWLEWLFSRDRWILQRAASKDGGTVPANGAYMDFPAATDAAKNGASNGTNGASNGSSSNHLRPGGAEAVYGEVIPPRTRPTFFMKVLGWSSVSEGVSDAEPSDNMDGLYAPRTQERRKAKRRELPQLVAYYWDGGASHPHSIRDISSTGFYVVTDIRWYPGTQVMVSLQRPDVADGEPYRSITVNAKVIRFGIDGLGFAFVMPEMRPSNGAGGSRKEEILNRQLTGFGGPRAADNATFISFLQQLPRNQDHGETSAGVD